MLTLATAVTAAIASGWPARALGGPCPPEAPGGCQGFLKGKHLALTAVLGSGIGAASLDAVGVTPDGKTGYGLRVDGALDEWDLSTGALRRVEIARFIALDPGGRWAVATQLRKDVPEHMWSMGGSGLELWDLASRRRVGTARVQWEASLSFHFSRRRILVQGTLDGDDATLVWDTASGKTGHPRETFCRGAAALAPDGTRAVCIGGSEEGDADDQSARDDFSVGLWDLDRMKIVRRMPARALRDRGDVAGLALSPDGRKALIAFAQGVWGEHTSLIWDLASGRIDKGPAFGPESGACLRWSPVAGTMMWIGNERDPGVGLQPIAGRGERKTTWLGDPEDRARDAVFLPDGKRILTGTFGRGVMRLVAVADGHALRASREATGHLGEVLSLSIARDGKRLLSCGKDHTARLWDLETNRPLRTIALEDSISPFALMTPDGGFAVASLKGLSLVTLPEGKVRERLITDRSRAQVLRAVSPGGGLVLVEGTLWEIPSGREVWSQSEASGAAVFSADERRIYVAASHKSLFSVIDAGSGVVTATIGKTGPQGQSPTTTFALAPREDFVVTRGGKDDPALRGSGGYELVARIDVPSGRLVWTIVARQYVRQLVLSPDGRWFVVTGAMQWGGDKADPMKEFPARVELRAATDGSVVDALDLDAASLTPFSAAFTSDGRTLFVGTEEGPILRFAVTP